MPKKNDLFVDTSGWAYYLDRQDPFYPKVVAIVQKAIIQRRRLVTTNYIVAELVTLLSSRFHLPRQDVIRVINTLKLDAVVEIVHIDTSLDSAAWHLLETRIDKEWSLVDASSFVLMERSGMTEALTTDHHFTQAGFIRLLV